MGKNPSPGSCERRVFTAQDELRWLQSVDRPIFDDDGCVVEFQSVGRDITERKRAESRLKTQYAITRILSESASIDEATPRIVQSICECLDWKVGEIWRVDGETKLSTFVKAWHLPSRDFAEFASASVRFTFPPGVGLPGRVCESRKPVWIPNLADDSSFRRVSLATKAGLRSGFGFPILLGEETLGAMVFFSREVREPDHDVLQMIASIGSQIGQFTERKRAEHLINQVFECSPDAVSIVGRDYRYQRVNPGYARIGRPAERMVGMHVADVVGMDVFERTVKPNLDRCFAGEEISYAEWFDTALGRRYLAVSYSPLRPDSERVDAGLVIIRDLTEPMLASEALRQAQAELAHVTRVATLGELTASIAHEINQPLAAVVNNAGACLRWLAAQNMEEGRQSAARVIADGHRLAEIIGRIRNLAKKAPPQKDWLDINDAIREILALARGEVQRNSVALETQLAGDVPLILGDRIQLQQVLLNLIMNAIEAMSGGGEGPRELWISSEKAESSDVLIAVRDSGPGLDPKGLNRLFEAFYTTKPDGLGMGLTISRSIVEAHGGRLWATANSPHGAVFQFTLPIGGTRVP